MNIILYVFSFLFGAVFASFSGVIIARVPEHQSILKPPSHCPKCNHRIMWYDNIPILSYLVLRGKCRYCKSRIPFSSFVLECLGGILFLLASLRYPFSYHLAFYDPILILLLIISYIDMEHHFIYDACQILFFVLVSGDIITSSVLSLSVPVSNLIGGGCGFAFFLLLHLFGRFVLKKDILGSGDVILLGIMGLHVGYLGLVFLLLVASFTGSVIELIRKRIKGSSEIPFAPYLCFGYVISLLYFPLIYQWLLEVI